jgi:hypothetical protein
LGLLVKALAESLGRNPWQKALAESLGGKPWQKALAESLGEIALAETHNNMTHQMNILYNMKIFIYYNV